MKSSDGLTGACLVSIQVQDANDNVPVFSAIRYNITVREGYRPAGPLLVVSATDEDVGTFGEAHVHIQVIDSDANAPVFTQSSYLIKTPEDILPGISIGSVLATGPGIIRYRYLDADKHDRVVLNVQAELLNGATNQTQVVILIQDHNDNSPKFPVDVLEITVSENQSLHEPFYVVRATDKDKKKPNFQNGAILYSLISSHPPCPVMVLPLTGQLQLTEPLDFEKIKTYRIRIKAQDQGIPPRSANMTLIIHVSDFNDNHPVFENSTYEAEVAENSIPMTAVLQVKAHDADSRENGQVLYRITNGSSVFGIDEKSGLIYTNGNIDREVRSTYGLTITAQDKGKPPFSSSVHVRVLITDVNDNPPSCSSTTSMVVPIDSTLLTTVGTVVVTDPDNGANGTVIYRSQQSHPLFIVKSNGDVQLRRSLRESDPSDVRLSIIASDQGLPPKSTVCHVRVKIGHGTSAVKLIEPFERNIHVPKDCLTGCQLQQLNATGVAKWQIQSNGKAAHDISSTFADALGIVVDPLRP
ncbi:unnamed protein product [Angiostrongylus costaricensis]|uniref:Cadherin domain protein n=1 Tax=Angiostrongylus costaricensis TaxID=334426 RepID=A0A0R3PFT2_ANGCS|nr:unnamed protein product [Angiostrongylus costaricensis]